MEATVRETIFFGYQDHFHLNGKILRDIVDWDFVPAVALGDGEDESDESDVGESENEDEMEGSGDEENGGFENDKEGEDHRGDECYERSHEEKRERRQSTIRGDSSPHLGEIPNNAHSCNDVAFTETDKGDPATVINHITFALSISSHATIVSSTARRMKRTASDSEGENGGLGNAKRKRTATSFFNGFISLKPELRYKESCHPLKAKYRAS